MKYVKMVKTSKWLAVMAMTVCLAAAFGSLCRAENTYEPFIRIDGDDPAAFGNALKNVRIISGDRFEFKGTDPKYGIDPDFVPVTEGLDTLNISASAQYGEQQFYKLADAIREAAGDREVYVFDLRRESHAILNGIPFSLYALHNWSNEGMSSEEVQAAEAEMFGALVGTTITAHPKEDDAPGDGFDYEIISCMTEKELVESRGFHYIRIPVTDHSWPEPEQVDEFVDFAKGVDMDDVWLHFHCHAGKGRTVLYTMMYDKMKNPDVPMMDIIVRQTLLGGTYPLYTKTSDNYKVPKYEEKARMTELFFRYVDENIDSNYAISWSEWLRTQALEDAA